MSNISKSRVFLYFLLLESHSKANSSKVENAVIFQLLLTEETVLILGACLTSFEKPSYDKSHILIGNNLFVIIKTTFNSFKK